MPSGHAVDKDPRRFSCAYEGVGNTGMRRPPVALGRLLVGLKIQLAPGLTHEGAYLRNLPDYMAKVRWAVQWFEWCVAGG